MDNYLMSELHFGRAQTVPGKIDIYEVWDELRRTVKEQQLAQSRLNKPTTKPKTPKGYHQAQDVEIGRLSNQEREIEQELRQLDARLRNSRYKLAVAESKFPGTAVANKQGHRVVEMPKPQKKLTPA